MAAMAARIGCSKIPAGLSPNSVRPGARKSGGRPRSGSGMAQTWVAILRIDLGKLAAWFGILAGLAACAPHEAASDRAPIVAAHSVSSVGGDWCFQSAAPPVAAPTARQRTAQGFRWLEQARRTGDPGFLISAAACAEIDESLASPPLDPEVERNLLRIQVLMSQHQFARAHALAERWLSTGDAPPLAMLLASDALLELGDVERATAQANAAMRARPDQNAYARVAHLRWLHGDAEGAKALYLDLLKNRDPRQLEATAQRFLELAKIVASQGDQKGARALVNAGLQAMPEHRDSLLWMGRAALADGDLPAVRGITSTLAQGFVDIPVLALQRDLAQHEQQTDLVTTLNAEIERLGRRGESLAYALDLLECREAPARALALILAERQSRGGLALDAAEADARSQLGEFDVALARIDQALRLGTPEPSWHALRAKILEHMQRPEDAQQALAQVARIQVLAMSSDATTSLNSRSP